MLNRCLARLDRWSLSGLNFSLIYINSNEAHMFLSTSIRLVFDHATGKPKGFGFCEYRDPETAASALRNLQGVEVGGRGLRLDFADTEDAPPSRRGDRPPGGGGGGGTGPPPSKPLPPGVQLPPGASAVDSITQTLATIPPSQLLDIMGQMKVGSVSSIARLSTEADFLETDLVIIALVKSSNDRH